MSIKAKLIKKFYQGTCSKQELNVLLDLLNQSAAAEDLEVLQDLWNKTDDYPILEDQIEKRITNNTLSKIDQLEAISGPPINQPPNPVVRLQARRTFFIRIAGVAATLLLIVSVWFIFQKNQPALHIIQTTYGEQKELILPDQSLVVLNANSTIKYPKNWKASEDRKVWLSGEAYFEVQKKEHTKQKFQVLTDKLTVEVLGTVFNVNTHSDHTNVFLKEGKVNLLLENQKPIEMEPGELVSYSKIAKKAIVRKIIAEKPTSWKDGTITFKDTKLADIINKMEELYGLKIKVDRETQLERAFNLDIPVDNAQQAFQVLKIVTQLNLRLE